MPTVDRRTRSVLALLGLLLVAGLVWWFQGSDNATTYVGTADPTSVVPGKEATAAGVDDDATARSDDALAVIALAALPPEGRAVVEQIHDGGPFRYDRDGIAFGNREGLLPPQPRGYYSEYTVPTPGESDRGARRIVAGEDGTMYYSDDHYASFRRIQE